MALALPRGMLKVTVRSLRYWSLCLLCLLGAASAEAGTVRLAWDPGSEPDVAGFKILYGNQSRFYTGRIDVARATDYTITSLPDGIYYFAVQAYTSDGTLSMPSNEVVAAVGNSGIVVLGGCTTSDPFVAMGGGTCVNGGWLPPSGGSTPTATSPPPPPPIVYPGGCTTPDPFVAMGGGVCSNGGWRPPTTTPPSASTTPPPTSTAPPPPPTSVTGCSTPDPFVAMGGGICSGGGWRPPNMTSSGGSTTPPPTTPPPPTPPPAPPSGGSAGCATPDPFVAMGGGTCSNGGWRPPTMTSSGGGSTTPAPTTPPPAPPSGGSAGCTTPDPFVAMGGGTCSNGGWLPPGMNGATGQITVTGTLHILAGANAGWQIEGDNKVIYTSRSAVPAPVLVDGVRVTFVGVVLTPASAGVPAIVNILSIETQAP